MSKECADCGNERIMLCPFCEHDFSEASKQKDAELLALRETVRVLGEECKAWREHRRLHDERSVFSPSGRHPSPDEYNAYKEPRERAWTALCRARHEVNANPGARAAVENAQ